MCGQPDLQLPFGKCPLRVVVDFVSDATYSAHFLVHEREGFFLEGAGVGQLRVCGIEGEEGEALR